MPNSKKDSTKRKSAAEQSKPKKSTAKSGARKGAGKGERDPSVDHSRREKDARLRGNKPPKSARGVGPPCEKCGQVHKRCSAHNRAGGPCGQQPLRFSQVCRSHGGSTKQSRKAAQERMMELVWPAIARLDQLVRDPNTDPAIVVKVVAQILDRAHGAGLGRNANLSVGFAEETRWDRLIGPDSTAFQIQRGRDAVIDPEDDPPALPGRGGNEDTDEALTAFLDQRERERAREASTRISNDGHEVVRGDVIGADGQRASADPFRVEEKERAEFARRTSEFDPERVRSEERSWARYEERVREGVEDRRR